MTQFLLLNDIQTITGTFTAGEILDDRILNVNQLESAGAVVITFTANMQTVRERFVSLRSTQPTTNSSVLHDSLSVENLLPGSGLSPSNYFVIEDISDFPPAIGNIITLIPGITWINGTIIMGDTQILIPKNAFLFGVSPNDSLVWTGVGAGPHILFDGSVGDEFHSIRRVNCVGTGGEDMFGITAGIPRSIFVTFLGVLNASIGALKCTGLMLLEGLQVTGSTSGLRLSGTGGRIVLRLSEYDQDAGATSDIIDFGTSVWDFVSINEIKFTPAAGNFGIRALGTNSNLTPTTGRGEATNCRFDGPGDSLTGGISVDNIQWIFVDNVNLVNSIAVGQLEMAGNTTTTIADGTFEPVLGTFTSLISRRFTSSAAGAATYLGLNPRLFQFTAFLVAEMASGGAKSISFQIFHTPISTGTPVAVGSPVTLDVSGQGMEISLLGGIEIATGDVLQLRLRNNADGVGVTITDLEALITAVATGV